MVVWTQPAIVDLKHIHDYIAEDSKFYAKKVTQEIRERTETLSKLPNIGMMVPEIGKPEIQELHIYSYRIIYEHSKSLCHVLAVIHKRRDYFKENLV